MKKIYLIALTALFLTACSDFLTENPKEFLSPAVAYETEQGLDFGANGLYDRLSRVYFHNDDFGRIFGLWMAPSDIHHRNPEEDGYRFGACDNLDITSESGEVETLWNYYYKIITNAQMIIADSERLQWKDTELENRVKGEAYFFHAFGHFYLTQFFGDIPMVDRIYDKVKLNWERSPKSEVMKLVIDELKKAEEYLPYEPYKSQEGRITKGAAQHLLAYAYLCNEDYPNAEAAGKRLIESGHYNLVKNRFGNKKTDISGNVFWDLFQLNNHDRATGNTEALLVIQNEPYEFFPQIVDGDEINTTGLYELHVRFFYNHAYEDGGYGSSIKDREAMLKYGGRGKGYILTSQYWLDDLFTDANDVRGKYPCVQKRFEKMDGTLLCDWDELRASQKSNARSKASIGVMYRPYPTKWSWDGESTSGSWDTDATTRDAYLYRSAETYLIVAEALHFQGNDSETDGAAYYINQVRERAGATSITAAQVSIDYILDERARELYGEIPRKIDLWRTGKFRERIEAYSPNAKRKTWDEKFLTLPVPQNIIDLNIDKFMPQNTGWGKTAAE
ncbi:MAG: RagB/SusD family nutrient uptake outer membrane protein [Dysgonamonadaceae bacterium]|jgi:hypothetical protein|nr:RagB/SusD family nutrient uptake outer membrane protein [Dysgonamonadaceae bacterium]